MLRARALAAVAYLALAAHVGAHLHVVLVKHATCPSHGEVVHGSPEAAPAGGTERDALLADQSRVGAADEHCLVIATSRREMAGLRSQAAQPAQLFFHEALLGRGVAGAAPRLPILSLAPKTSPPARAV